VGNQQSEESPINSLAKQRGGKRKQSEGGVGQKTVRYEESTLSKQDREEMKEEGDSQDAGGPVVEGEETEYKLSFSHQ
jgi:hypothetical protein